MLDRGEHKAWGEFKDWCRARRLRALPAHPWTVAAYLRWCAATRRLPALEKRLGSILRAHLMACQPSPDRHPVILRTLRLLESQRRHQERRTSLFRADDFTRSDRKAAAPKRRHGLGSTPPLVRKGP
ncbi:MAG: hypothetical protein H7841_13420 [Magnetospirillum sp. WYHS-4]